MVKLFGKQGGEVTIVTGGMVQISKDGHGVTVIVIGHALGNGNTQVLFKEGKCKNVFCLLSKISTLTIGIFQCGILEYWTSGWFPCRCICRQCVSLIGRCSPRLKTQLYYLVNVHQNAVIAEHNGLLLL